MSGRAEKRVFHRDGHVLHRGPAASRKDLLARLAAQSAPVSLAGADLSGADLSGMDLSGVDFTGAKLDRADFRGAVLKRSIFKSADLREARLQGARIDGAVFDAADMRGAFLVGAHAVCSSFCAAALDRCDMTDIGAASASFRYARAEAALFVGADLRNADFRDARLVNCDFRGASVEHRVFGGETAEVARRMVRHLPNRTAGAVILGCDYGPRITHAPGAYARGATAAAKDKPVRLCGTVPAMKSDREAGRVTDFLLWSASTVAAVAAVEQSADAIAEYAHDIGNLGHFGVGFGFVAVMSGAYLLKEQVIDWARARMEHGLEKLINTVRETAVAAERVGVHRAHIAVMIAKQASLEPIRLALDARAPEARRRGWFGAVASYFSELGHVVICDRRHLALALATLSSRRLQDYPLPQDIVLMRCAPSDGGRGEIAGKESGPRVMSFLSDGRTTATWTIGGGQVGLRQHLTTAYDADGTIAGCWDPDGALADPAVAGLPPAHHDRLGAILAFEAALLDDHHVTGFDYARDTHVLDDGADGTILVRRASNRRIDNDEQGAPAVLRMDGSGLVVHNGSLISEWPATAFFALKP